MKGKNTITLCQAETMAAIQHYFEAKLFRKDACPKVTSVKQTNGIGLEFQVEIDGDGTTSYSGR